MQTEKKDCFGVNKNEGEHQCLFHLPL